MISSNLLLITIVTLLPNIVAATAIDVRDAGVDQDCAAVGPHVIGHYTLQSDGSGRIVPGTRPVVRHSLFVV
jgi:hypothetical protein